MSITNPSRSCYEVISELDAAAQGVLRPDQTYFVLGGIATAAINDPESVFDHQSSSLLASPSSALPVARKENGTRRDIDILVLDVLSKEQAGLVKQTISEAVGGALEISVFKIDKHREPSPLRRLGRMASAWTSKRTIDSKGQLYYELAPLVQAVPAESYQPWRLEMPGGKAVSMLNPAAHMLAYSIWSISGERHKDKQKIDVMRRRVEGNPFFMEQIHYGNLRSWLDFATAIQGLVEDTYVPLETLPSYTSRLELEAFRMRGQLLRLPESNETIVKYAQSGFFQKLLKPFIGSS